MRFTAALPALALLLATACTTPFEARVARFHALPPPTGQTFAIAAADPAKAGGLQFATYASYVRQKLTQAGFAEVADPRNATLIAEFDYGVSNPREKVMTRPGFGYGGFGYGGFGYPGFGYGGFGYGRYGYGRFGYGGFGGFGYGGFGGFGYDGFDGPEVYSVTKYNAFADVRINRAADKVSVFEGRAETVSDTNNLTRLVPNLVTAVFANFPGRSGETVRVRIDPQHPDAPIVTPAMR